MKKFLLLLAIFPFLIAFQERFDAKDDHSFKASREKIEKTLDQDKKINLEKALRVVAMESMRLKWEEPGKYEGKSFNEISFNMIDGLSYSSLVDLAEELLRNRNKKEINDLTKEIDSLNIQKTTALNTQKALNLFKINSIRIDMTNFFDELVPTLVIDYQYIGKNKLFGSRVMEFKVTKNSTKEVVNSILVEYGDDESVLENGEVITKEVILSQTKEANPKLWSAQQYPIENPNLADYDLGLKVSVLGLTLEGKKVEMPKVNIDQLDAEIKSKTQRINDMASVKGTLDDLELIDQ